MGNNTPEPACPANYFGKGADYVLPDSREEIQDYEEKWRKWMEDHPNDPTGELAIKEWEATTGRKAKLATEPKPVGEDLDEEFATLKLELNPNVIKQLKTYASFCRKRPRDIVARLIKAHCNIPG